MENQGIFEAKILDYEQVSVMEKCESNQVIFRDCIYKNNKIYFFDVNNIIPMSLDLDSEQCLALPIINWERFRQNRFDLETEFGNCLYALEIAGEYMCQYQLETGYIKYIKIDCNFRIDGNFALLDAYEECIYIFDRFGGVTVYDTVTEKIAKLQIGVNVSEMITGCRCKDKYFLFSHNGKEIIEFDTKSNQWKHRNDIGLPVKNIVHVVSDENFIYILSENGMLVIWDMKTRIEMINDAVEYYKKERAACRICLTKDSFVILPSLTEDILLINRQTHIVSKMENYPVDFRYDETKKHWAKYVGYCESDTDYFFANRTSGYVLKISKLNAEITWIKSEIAIKEQFCYEIENRVVYEKKGYLEWLIGKLREEC